VQESGVAPFTAARAIINGGCVLTMQVGGIREIRSWVLSWGADVEVLAPSELRTQIAHGR
jgi:predicted DNA-binding transcriptional regulator YafY